MDEAHGKELVSTAQIGVSGSFVGDSPLRVVSKVGYSRSHFVWICYYRITDPSNPNYPAIFWKIFSAQFY
jgi:hypothetical protein